MNTSATLITLISDISRLTSCTKGSPASTDTARSVEPSTVRIPARMIRVLEAKNEALRSRLPITLASAMRLSRISRRRIQSSRYRCSTLARQGVSLPFQIA
ncbi:hypothetical protein D3C84_608730 [compost metagenome]